MPPAGWSLAGGVVCFRSERARVVGPSRGENGGPAGPLEIAPAAVPVLLHNRRLQLPESFQQPLGEWVGVFNSDATRLMAAVRGLDERGHRAGVVDHSPNEFHESNLGLAERRERNLLRLGLSVPLRGFRFDLPAVLGNPLLELRTLKQFSRIHGHDPLVCW